jgi:hypothetical protein
LPAAEERTADIDNDGIMEIFVGEISCEGGGFDVLKLKENRPVAVMREGVGA